MSRVMFGVLVAALASAPVAAAPVKHKVAAKAGAHTPAKSDWTKTVVFTPEGGARMGNPNAKVKLIEYGSRTCPTCAAFTVQGSPSLKAGLVTDGTVSYEFRDFPIHGAIDVAPILLGRCVPVRAFFPLLEAMMANQAGLIGRKVDIPEAKKAELAKSTPNQVAAYLGTLYGYTDMVVKAGLPVARANACLADKKGVDAIVARADAANKLYQIPATPTFVVNGTRADNVFTWETLEPVLRAAAQAPAAPATPVAR